MRLLTNIAVGSAAIAVVSSPIWIGGLVFGADGVAGGAVLIMFLGLAAMAGELVRDTLA